MSTPLDFDDEMVNHARALIECLSLWIARHPTPPILSKTNVVFNYTEGTLSVIVTTAPCERDES